MSRTKTTSKLAGLLSLVLCLSACSSARGVQPTTEPEPTLEDRLAIEEEQRARQRALDSVYAALEADAAVYAAGIELLAAGEEVLGEEKIFHATEGLLAGTDWCAATPNCDVTRFLETFDRLLGRQSLVLKTQASRIEELEQSAQQDVEREPGTSPFVAAMPELERAEALLRGTDLAEIIKLNGPINAALDDWLTWMRPLLMDTWENYQWLRSEMAPVYEQAGLPEALLFAMMATETGGKVHSYSRAGAAGPLQFMRRTGRRYGLKVVDGFDMRLDPEAATRANVAYLNDQFEILNDNLEMALAAYNGGEGRMKNLSRRYRGSSLWDRKVYYSLPSETREYVPRVLAAAWLFMHPEDYGLEFPPVDAQTAMLKVRQDIAIDELTICFGQEQNPSGWFRTLRNLNPRLSPGDRVEAGQQVRVPAVLVPVYEERCLDGERMALARAMHDANYPPEGTLIPYIVRRGDTLGRIASRHGCVSLAELADLNRIRPPRYVIRVGQELKIPKCS